ncbi:type IV pilus assembly protein PilM [Curtobacterium sp. PhB130]|uniref:type IV pilus assembly protein PilM n=1 Tax=unclassified Curtobacterium TaxID=257496 RepID=UPI000F4C9DA1|nr:MULTISPECIES: type IV pilus assembly protein PilM [unclassified Curtobacterium]ROS77554.1 type IV pilus assembly protein PilM [Curtobacterium sp. PhB130]TCK66239.1 type IV pilus assembly protein PilM [Curtobacterium sp. PhB136]
MAKNVVGIDIGSEAIRAVEVADVDKAVPTILRFAEVPIPIDATKHGEVLEANTVAGAIRSLWSVGRFRSRDVVLGMGNQRVLSRDLTVPRGPLAQIRESLPFLVQDMLPVPVGDAILDFYPTSEGIGENGPVVHGLLVAAVKDAVLANVRAAQLAGLNPVGVDLIPFALTRMLAPRVAGSGTVAIVDCGGNTTSVVIATDGVPKFVRIIPTGGDDVTKTIAARLEIGLPEAEAVKRHFGLSGQPRTPDDLRAVAATRESVGELLQSIRNTVNYFANTRADEPVQSIVLVGGGSVLPGLREGLGDFSGLPVAIGNPFVSARAGRGISPEVLRERGPAISVAWSLAVGSRAA